MIKKHLVVTALFLGHIVYGQQNTFKIPDSLQSKDYDYLFDRIEETDDKSYKQSLYLQLFLSKAKSEKNPGEIVNGYKNYLYHSPKSLRLVYADSMIYAAKKSVDNALIGSAYLTKGILYYGNKKHNEALDLFLRANQYICKTTDNYLIHKVKYHIAVIKLYLGFYDEAVSIFRECASYFKEENDRAYLNSLRCLALSYNKVGDYGFCSQTNALGFTECRRLKIPEMKVYFMHSEGINNYFKHNYGKAIKDIKSSLAAIQKNGDFANISIGNFYIGKSYWAQDKKEKALPYFLKVDKIFNEKGYLRPDLREVYELLITYYKKRDNPLKQLYYVDQLIKADNLLFETNHYLIGKVHKEYDTVVLVAEKEKLQKELLSKKSHDLFAAIIILLLCSISLFIFYRHYKNRSLYKKKYDALMESMNEENQNKPKIKTEKTGLSDIHTDTITSILTQLEKFEKNKRFLEKDWTLVTLSATFNSNTKYLSNIISHYRDKGFVEYINDLRIEYIISLLRNETKFRNYTNSALAQEAGFSSTQRFALCFKAKTEMPVNFFIEELKKGNL